MKPPVAILTAPVFLLTAQAPAAPAAPHPIGLCTAAERPIFSCGTSRQIVSVCAGARGVQYRAGRPGHVVLASPAKSAGLSYANTAYSGGGESQVRFVTAHYAYVVWSGVYRTGFKTTNDPLFESGVIVRKGSTVVSARKCVAPRDADLDLSLAQKLLPEGDFTEHE
jgi:hypothetical protein